MALAGAGADGTDYYLTVLATIPVPHERLSDYLAPVQRRWWCWVGFLLSKQVTVPRVKSVGRCWLRRRSSGSATMHFGQWADRCSDTQWPGWAPAYVAALPFYRNESAVDDGGYGGGVWGSVLVRRSRGAEGATRWLRNASRTEDESGHLRVAWLVSLRSLIESSSSGSANASLLRRQ